MALPWGAIGRRSRLLRQCPEALLWMAGLAACIATAACTRIPDPQSFNFPLTVRKERVLRTSSDPVAVAWSADGSRIAAAIEYGSQIVVWDRSGRRLYEFPVGPGTGPNVQGSLAFGEGNSQVLFVPPRAAPSDVALSVYDVTSGQVVRNVTGPEPGLGAPFNQAGDFTTSPEQGLLATDTLHRGSKGVNVAIFDTSDWRFIRGFPILRGPTSLNFFAKGQKIVAGSVWGVATVLDAASTGPPRQFQALGAANAGPDVSAVAGSPDGELIFVGCAGQLDAVVLRAADGVQTASFPIGRASRRPRGIQKGVMWLF